MMRTFLAVARREIVERRFVLLAAAVSSLFPFLVPVARHLSGAAARDAKDWTAIFLAFSIAAGLAVGLGATVFVADLASRRAGFFFSRPISAAQLWAGKLVGAFALVLLGLFVAAGPAWITGRGLLPLRDLEGGPWAAAGAAVAALLLLLLVSHAMATMIRSRSWLAFADMAACAAISFVSARAAIRLLGVDFEPRAALLIALGATVFAALLFAAHRSVERGRTDLRAAHRALSGALWGFLGSAAIVFVLYSGWVLAAPPTALSRLDSVSPAGGGGWLFVGGRARGARSGWLLYEGPSRRSIRASALGWTATRAGDFAAWVESETGYHVWSLRVARLSPSGASVRETKVVFERPVFSLALSPDGARVAALEASLLTVSEIETGRVLASARAVEGRDYATISFVSPGRVRVLRRRAVPAAAPGAETLRLDVLELDIRNRTLAITGTMEERRGAFVFESPTADRLLVRTKGGASVTLRDGRTLGVLATLREGDPLLSAQPTFLSDGRIALALSDAKASWLELFSAEGAPAGRIELGGPATLRPGAEPAPGTLLVSVRLKPERRISGAPEQPAVLELVDLERGTARPVAQDLAPIRWWFQPTVPAGSEASKLFLDHAGRLVHFDPATGERRVVLGRG